jgi:hypothetical protein
MIMAMASAVPTMEIRLRRGFSLSAATSGHAGKGQGDCSPLALLSLLSLEDTAPGGGLVVDNLSFILYVVLVEYFYRGFPLLLIVISPT